MVADAHAANTSVLSDAQLVRGISRMGDTHRLRRKLERSEPLTFVVLGASNVVRGGCEVTQRSKCSIYTNGWINQAWRSIKQRWPTSGAHELYNHGMMATGPSGVTGCIDTLVPAHADAVLLAFADMCTDDGAGLQPKAGVASQMGYGATGFGRSLESIIRSIAARADPPSLVLFNSFSWLCAKPASRLLNAMSEAPHECAFSERCDATLTDLAAYYHISIISVRDAMYL